jgi:predicted nucleotidyltransferase
MHSIIEENIPQIMKLCRKHRVNKLAIFGSVTRKSFDPSTSDLDMIVEFEKMSPAEHAKRYFGLLADLEDLLRKPVDLVEPGPIRNPYFRESIEESQVVLYAAPAAA